MSKIKTERMSQYLSIRKDLCGFNTNDIEEGIVLYCLEEFGCDSTKFNNLLTSAVRDVLRKHSFSTDLENVVDFLESLLEETNKNENGIVFTPKYISDYIVEKTFNSSVESTTSIIDPGCGCGIFLISAAEQLLETGKDVCSIINENIFGIDIDPDNARRCEMVLKLFSAKHGGDYNNTTPNILCKDSLKCDWNKAFRKQGFDCIIGNPPYVNPHDMNKETVKYLKCNFETTKGGVFNIFYAFIEHAMNFLTDDGELGYIVPNNFLTIKSAMDLRKLLKNNNYLKCIIDFGDNMVFKPVRTYNCLLFLSATKRDTFRYSVIKKTDDIQGQLKKVAFDKMRISDLGDNGWRLVDSNTRNNIRKIENKGTPIKEFIRTGIATLRDGVYLVELDDNGYFKRINGEKHYIEDGLVKPIYKVPELKLKDDPEETKRYIIFPYVRNESGYSLIPEEEFLSEYPKTYNCLLKQKEILDSRDKGKGVAHGWYAYGRTQGLNKYGRKLLFPTFSNHPKFSYIDNEDALFCNGYAVFENDKYELSLLERILNSKLMHYYVSNTSYSIEGGYYCYQKKYVENFSIPNFSNEELDAISRIGEEEIDDYLWDYYGLN